MNFDFITNEELPLLLDEAKEKGVKIFWIALKPSTIEDSGIDKYQAVHKDPPLIQLNPVDRDIEHIKTIYLLKPTFLVNIII